MNDQDDFETFRLLGCRFDIVKAKAMVSRNAVVERGQIAIKDIWKWINVINIDEDFAAQITQEQLQAPVILAKFVDQDLLVDGYHRLTKAMSLNLETLPFASINAQDIMMKGAKR
jgi:hypothetical protein